MKYHPIRNEHSHDRDYIGEHWNRKYIRAVQAILNATKGKIGRGVSFFEKAFGRNEEEYMELLRDIQLIAQHCNPVMGRFSHISLLF